MSLEFTRTDSLLDLFPSSYEDYIRRIAQVAGCVPGTSFADKILDLVGGGGLPLTISKTLTDNTTESWEFPVVNGRSGSIATAVDGATINASSTISIEYSLVASPAASDWKVYDNGSFTGAEVNKVIEFVGVLNRIVWTPAASEDLNVMISL